MRSLLIPLDGGDNIEITKDMTIVGRKEECDVRLEHKSVSKMHCTIVKTDGLLLLRDLGSTNGTRVNGTRIRRAALLPNDQLNIASYKFRVHLGPDEPAVGAGEHTMQLNADDMARLMKKAKEKQDDDESSSDEDVPRGPTVQPNALPDVYEEDEKKR